MHGVLKFLVKVLIAFAIVLAIGTVGLIECRYTIDAEVYNVSSTVVYFKDSRSYIWAEKCDSNTYEVGEKVKLVMHSNTTDHTADDDYILRVKK